MSSKQFLMLVALAIGCSLIGGGLTFWLLVDKTAFAQHSNPKEVVAETFKIVDAKGNIKGIIGTKGGAPFFGLKGKDKEGILLDMTEDGPVFTLINRGGRQVASLFTDQNGNGRLKIADSTGKKGEVLLNTSTEGATLLMSSVLKNNIVMEDGKNNFLNVRLENSVPGLFLLRSDHSGLSLEANDVSAIRLMDKSGVPKAGLSVSNNVNALRLGREDFGVFLMGKKYDYHIAVVKEGKAIWSAP